MRKIFFVAGLIIFLLVTAPNTERFFNLLPFTGLIEAYLTVEEMALSLVPDSIEELVKKLSAAL